MRKIFILVLVAGIATAIAVAKNSQGTDTQDEQQLRKIEAETAKLEQQNDASMVSLFANDFVAVGSNKILSKHELEEAVKSNFVSHGNGPSPVTIEKKNMLVYLFGDTAVVSYMKEYRQTTDITKFSDEDYTDVFKRGPKGWLLQFTKISPAVNKPTN